MKISRWYAACFISLLLLAALCHAQEKVRTVADPGKIKYENQPIELVGCEIGDGTVSSCAQIVGGEDWWKNLTVTLKNVSAKAISEFNIELAVKKQGKMTLDGNIVLVPQPLVDSVRDETGRPSFNFRRRVEPGEIFRMTVPDIAFQQMSTNLRSYGVSEFDHMSLNIQFIFFDDGTRWDFGVVSQIPAGQSLDVTQKRINRLLSGREPIEIIGLQANGKTINLNETFMGEGDWLKDMTITFKNTSGRTIRCIYLYLSVLESKPIGPPPGMSIVYGSPRTSMKEDKKTMTSLAPGETDSVRIGAALFESLKKSLVVREDIVRRTTAELRITDVWFADDTSWSWGKFYKLNQAGGLMLDGDDSGKRPNELPNGVILLYLRTFASHFPDTSLPCRRLQSAGEA